MKVYVLIQPSGSYEDSRENIIGVYEDKGLAEADGRKLDDQCVIPCGDEDNIVPAEIYYGWPLDEETKDYIKEYKGYTIDMREKQAERFDLYFREFGHCYIDEYELVCKNKK